VSRHVQTKTMSSGEPHLKLALDRSPPTSLACSISPFGH